jgi:DNA helicase-2/ATP-dependent DNA helicase PcrA
MTFTNKAAQEMRNRVQQLLNDDEKSNPFISTFHAFCYRVLREEVQATELKKNFTIIDVAEQKILLKRIVKELHFEHENQIEKQAL